MDEKTKKDRASVNDRLISEIADRVHGVLLAAFGTMQAPTLETIKQDLRTAHAALQAYPDVDSTHGRVILRRQVHASDQYDVLVNLGPLTIFSTED